MSFHKLEKYVSNPTQLQGLKYKQPFLVSDSREFTLKKQLLCAVRLRLPIDLLW